MQTRLQKLRKEKIIQKNMIEKVNNNDIIINNMYNQISDIISNNRNKIIYQINNTLVEYNFMIGKIIVEIKPDAIPQALDFGLRKSKLTI